MPRSYSQRRKSAAKALRLNFKVLHMIEGLVLHEVNSEQKN